MNHDTDFGYNHKPAPVPQKPPALRASGTGLTLGSVAGFLVVYVLNTYLLPEPMTGEASYMAGLFVAGLLAYFWPPSNREIPR